MGVGKPKRRHHSTNVSVTRAPPYKVLQRNLNPPFKAKWGKTQATGKVSHTRRQGCSPDVVKYGSELESLKAKWGKESEPFATTKCHTHAAAGLLPQYKCWNTDLNNRPKEKRRKKNGATQTTKVVA